METIKLPEHELLPGHLISGGSLVLNQTEQTKQALHDAAVSRGAIASIKAAPLNWHAPDKKDC